MLSFSAIYLISEWCIRLAMVPVVVRRRSPAAATSWLVVIFALPWVGLVLYLLIGRMRLGKYRAARHAEMTEAVQTVDRLSLTARFHVRPEISDAHRPIINLAMNSGGLPIVGGNEVDLIPHTDAFINALIADIESAEHHVHILCYIIRDDATGQRVTEALIAAEQRGVQCRVLYDAVGSARTIGRLPTVMRKAGIDVHDILPVNPLRRSFARIDLRNHRKLIVIDGQIAYTGSQNIVDADYGTRDLTWFDLMARVTGPAASHLQLVFLQDWYYVTDSVLDEPAIMPEPITPGEAALQVVPSGPSMPTERFENLVVEAITHARRHLIITTPYFVPDEPTLRGLKLAVMRGATVDLVVPQRIDQYLVGAASRSYFTELLDAGVNIHRFTGGLLHSKTMTVDDAFGMVGSANFDIRSFRLNFELNLMMYGPQPTARLRFIQQGYMNEANKLDRKSWKQRPAPRQLAEDVARLFSPLL